MISRGKPDPKAVAPLRCAVYTRKSHEEGLDQDFNSLDAQRQSAEAYIASQKSDGWVLLETRYDDAAYSAATTDRPALQRLLSDIERGLVDVVVVYKIDRLSRSLRDFGRLIEAFEVHGVSFVSVTQRFDTSSSMGKLTLNILMSFAEFEREVTRERICDKIALAKQRGKHTGGMPVLGYTSVDRKLVVVEAEAELVRHIFRRFSALRSTLRVARDLARDGHRTKSWTTKKGTLVGGKPFTKRGVYDILTNRKYLGLVVHRDKEFPGEHAAIVERAMWDRAQRILGENRTARSNETRAKTRALLRGLLRCVSCDRPMTPTFTTSGGRRYPYYCCARAASAGYAACPVRSLAAGEVEAAVIGQLQAIFRAPEVVARTYREAKSREREEAERLARERSETEKRLQAAQERLAKLLDAGSLRDGRGTLADEVRRTGDLVDGLKRRLSEIATESGAFEADVLSEDEVREALSRLNPLWSQLFPAEQARIVELLVERVDVFPERLELRIRADGLRSLVAEVSDGAQAVEAAG